MLFEGIFDAVFRLEAEREEWMVEKNEDGEIFAR